MYTSAACSSPIGQSRCGNRHTSSDGSVDSVANHGRTLACQLSTRLQYDSPDRVKVEYFQSRFERFVLSGPGCGSSLQCCVAYALLSMDPKPLTSNLAVHPAAMLHEEPCQDDLCHDISSHRIRRDPNDGCEFVHHHPAEIMLPSEEMLCGFADPHVAS